MKNIIAIQGTKGSGKDEIAKYISYLLNTPFWMHTYWIAKLLNFKSITHKWKITRYADSLKKMLAILMNVDINKFEDREFKEYYYFDFNNYRLLNSKVEVPKCRLTDKSFNRALKKGDLDIAVNYILSIRQILQFFGTDIMRRFFGDKLWIYNTLYNNYNNLIIADQRFEVENQEISKSDYRTYIIHVVREGYTSGLHPSEKELDKLLNDKKYDILIENNSTLRNLFNKCKNIVYSYLV